MTIREIVELERYCRDYGLWEVMKKLFLPHGTVHISWFDGTSEDFIESSKKMSGAKHKIYNTVVQVNSNKAVAEVITQIQSRNRIEDTTGDMISDVRLLYRLVKTQAAWRILSIDCIYEKDMFLPSDPCKKVFCDIHKLENYRDSYKYLCYILQEMGKKINLDLPGEDRPELIQKLYDKSFSWLESKN